MLENESSNDSFTPASIRSFRFVSDGNRFNAQLNSAVRHAKQIHITINLFTSISLFFLYFFSPLLSLVAAAADVVCVLVTVERWTERPDARSLSLFANIFFFRILQGMRILVMLLLDTLPMLGNVLLLCFFVFFIFGIVGVQLWEGILRQRCALQLPMHVAPPE